MKIEASNVVRWAILISGALVSVCGAYEAKAQYRAIVLDPDPEARVVASVIRFQAGAADDPRGREGTAFMLGRLLERQASQAVTRYGSGLRIETGTDELLIFLVSDPAGWDQALLELERLLYRASLSEADLEPVRSEILQILQFESGAPVRAFENERESFLLGAGHPAARPIQGTPVTIGAITASELEDFRSSFLRPEEAVVAVTGPVRPEELRSVLSGDVRSLVPESGPVAPPGAQTGAVGLGAPRDSIPPVPELRLYRTGSPALEVPGEPLGPPAWTVGERTVIDRELTSTWISVAFPFPLGTPELLLDFLGHLIIEDLIPSPPDPGLFEAQVRRASVRGAPVLVVTASVDPQVTSRWEERLTGVLVDLAEAPPAGAFFELTRRRFRSAVLLDQAVPENRALWLARQVATGSDPSVDLREEMWSLQRPAVGAAAAAAGPPRTILLGPSAMMNR